MAKFEERMVHAHEKSKHTGSGAAVGCCAGIRYAACLGVGCRYSRTRDRGNRASGSTGGADATGRDGTG